MKIHHWNPATDGALTVESACARFHDMGYTCACYTYPPGTVFPKHTHEIDKINLVLKGRFLIGMNDKEVISMDAEKLCTQG